MDVLTDPYESGYRSRQRIDRGGDVGVPYGTPTTITVTSLLDADS